VPPMAFEAILADAAQLHNVSNRLEALAEQHPPVSEALMMISGSVRDTATVLEVLIVTKTAKPN
jgi:hypothetical protein